MTRCRLSHRRRAPLVCLAAALLAADAALPSDYALDFSRSLDVWSWDQVFAWNRPFAERFTVIANATHARRISDAPGFSRHSDGTTADMRVEYALTPRLSTGVGLAVDQSRLEGGGAASDVISRRLDALVRVAPIRGLVVDQSLGRAYDQRRAVSDAGLAYGTHVSFTPFPDALAGHGLALSMSYARHAVRSKQGDSDDELTMEGRWASGPAFVPSLRFHERREDQRYVTASAGNPILRRATRARTIEADLSASHRGFGAARLRGSYETGTVDDDASNDPTNLKFGTNNHTSGWRGSLDWTLPVPRPRLVWVVSYGRNERTASRADSLRFVPAELDRRRSDLVTSLSSTLALGRHDSLTVSGALSLETNHTPATSEVNDRDDYRRSLVAIYRHAFSARTSTELRVERIETHEVWLQSQRSGNNKWDRALNLWATTRVAAGPIALTQRAFFKAALEEFDFDYLTPQSPRSRNVRIGRLDFTAAVPWVADGALTLAYAIEARTRGTLVPADGHGQRPHVWQVETNELAHVLGVTLRSPVGRLWVIEPSATLSRRDDHLPTQARWDPFHLGQRRDRQESLEIGARLTYRPTAGILGGDDALQFALVRTYRRRADYVRRVDFDDSRSYISLTYKHVF